MFRYLFDILFFRFLNFHLFRYHKMATITTKLVIKLISCELCENICGRGVCLPCCSVQACRGCATKKVRGVYSAGLIFFFLGCKIFHLLGGWLGIFYTYRKWNSVLNFALDCWACFYSYQPNSYIKMKSIRLKPVLLSTKAQANKTGIDFMIFIFIFVENCIKLAENWF